MANVAVNATISARDAASGNINKVNNSLKALKIGFGLAAAAGALLTKFTFDAINAAAEDEMSNARLNAALKARGFLTDDLAGKVKEQTAAMAALGITDDQVRAGIEVGSRFFADQTTILEANSVAADVAAVTGQSLADVVETIGKGAQGQTKGLRALGVQVNKGATAQDILTAISTKYSGIASEIADTTGGKYLAAQVEINEKMEEFGYKLLPAVNGALEFMTDTVLPAVETQLGLIGEAVDNVVDNHFDPFKESLDQFSQIFGEGEESFIQFGNERYWNNVFRPITDALDKAKVALDLFNEAYKFFLTLTGQPIPGFVPGSDPMNDKYGGGVRGNVNFGTGGIGAAPTTVVTTVSIGTEKVDTVVSRSLQRIGGGGRNQ